MRILPHLPKDRLEELQEAWQQKQSDRNRRRLLVIRLVAQRQHTAEEIAQIVGMARRSVFRYLKSFVEDGVCGLCQGRHRGSQGQLNEKPQEQFRKELAKGTFRRAKEALQWLQKRGVQMSLSNVYYWLGKVGGVLNAQGPRAQRSGSRRSLP